MLLYCVPCDHVTTELEARLRNFNALRCARCGGDLLSIEGGPPDDDEPEMAEP